MELMMLKTIAQEDDSHTEADGNDKYGIQFSDKRYGHHTVLRAAATRQV